MKTKSLFAGLLFFAAANLFSQNGEQLFKANCGICHTVGKGKLTGPDLKNVHTRREESWLLKWVKSSQSLVKSGDKDAVAVFEENGKIVMPDQNLNEADIKAVLGFVKAKSEEPVAPPVAANAEGKAAHADHVCGSSLYNTFGFSGYIMIFLIGLLLLVLWVAVLAVKSLSKELAAKNSAATSTH